MKEFYIYMAVVAIWALFLNYIDLSGEQIFRSCTTMILIFGLNLLIQIKNTLNNRK